MNIEAMSDKARTELAKEQYNAIHEHGVTLGDCDTVLNSTIERTRS